MPNGSPSCAERPGWSDWLAYLAYAGWQAAASPVLIARAMLRAGRRGQKGVLLRRALQLPWSRAPVDLLIVGNWTGETRVAWLAAKETEALAPRRAVLAGTKNAGSLQPRSEAIAGWAPSASLPSALLCIARYTPRGVWVIRRNEQHHLAFWCWALGIPMDVVDAFLTEDDERRISRWKPWDRWRMRSVRRWGVPDPAQVQRLQRSGVPRERIVLVGPSLGCEVPTDEELTELRAAFRSRLEGRPSTAVVVAGSMHPSDEPIVVEAFRRLGTPDKLLVIAPRKVERSGELIRTLERSGLAVRRWSDVGPGDADAVMVDTVGELARLYAAADAAFVGGSFDAKLGGHTPAEPLAAGAPVAIGPEFEQQRPLVSAALQAGALRVVRTPEELADAWTSWLTDPSAKDRCRAFARSQSEAFRRFWQLTVD